MSQGSDLILARMMALHPKIIDLTLDRVWRLLAALGHPEVALPPVIHIAGTNGKGSTTAFLRAIFEAAGARVHVYTSPHLVRFHERIMLAGGLVNVACLIVAMSGVAFENFLAALLLLGIGWNFLYTGATTLLTETYTLAERAKTQALNDFLVFTSTALASLSAGAMLHVFGWWWVNIGVIPLVLVIIASLGWLGLRPAGMQARATT